MMPDNINGADRVKFSRGRHVGLENAAAHDVPEDRFGAVALQRGWVGQSRDHTRFARYLFTALSNRTDGTHRLVRNGRHQDGVNVWRRLHMEYAPVTNATAQGSVKKSLEFASSANTSEVSSAVQLLEEIREGLSTTQALRHALQAD